MHPNDFVNKMNCFHFQGQQSIRPCLDHELYNTSSSSPLAQSLTEFYIDTIGIGGTTATTPFHYFKMALEKNKVSWQKTQGNRKKRDFEHDRFHFLEEGDDE